MCVWVKVSVHVCDSDFWLSVTDGLCDCLNAILIYVICILYDVRVFICFRVLSIWIWCVCVESVDTSSSFPPSVLLSGWVVVSRYLHRDTTPHYSQFPKSITLPLQDD